MVFGNMEHPTGDQQRVTSAASSSSSLSYLSVVPTPSPEELVKWTPRRRHAPPPALPTHRRARGYEDLFPFEVSQLASVLCHAPPVNTPRDGAVWTAYVAHTNQRIALLGPKLRSATSLPSFLPWPTNHKLCSLHRRLNARPLEDIFAALRYEIEVRRQKVWQHVALAGALSASQTEQLALMDELQSLWLSSSEFMKRFNRLPSPRYARQADGCVACILARMGENVETAMALGALLLGSMRRSDMLSTRVCWCREWVRYTVDGDVDCVDAALIEMEKMGTKFREARKWARQRAKATSEHRERNLGLGGMPYVQPTRVSSLQATTDTQVPTETGTESEALDQQQDKQFAGSRGQHKEAIAGQQSSPQHLPLKPCLSTPGSRDHYFPEPLASEPLLPDQTPSDLYSAERYYSAHNSPEPQIPGPERSVARARSPEPTLPLQRRSQEPITQANWANRNMLLDPSSVSQVIQTKPTSSTVRSRGRTTSPEPVPSTTVDIRRSTSPTSLYSEFTGNPFLDGNSSPSPYHDRHLPPDLPFRLFERRRACDNDGMPSPPKNAVQWPNQTMLTKRSTVEQFKDGLVPVPFLARLDKGDRGVGALWKRRAGKMEARGESSR
ncbi:hypothetical protein E4T49_00418 [Aureobasidium sp. EXF-10728]|nr:hypothetical protein E4T49_00418 [Aureobasidium sp. EXF-10728]